VIRRRQASANVFTFPLGSAAGGPGVGGDNPGAMVPESWLAQLSASFNESGFDELTCNLSATFQDSVV
jgi:hypothetical protein